MSPLANTYETHPITDHLSAQHPRPLANIVKCGKITDVSHTTSYVLKFGSALSHPLANVFKLTPVMINACCTHSNVVNFGVNGPKLRNLNSVAELLALDLLKAEEQSCNPFWKANAGSATNELGVVS